MICFKCKQAQGGPPTQRSESCSHVWVSASSSVASFAACDLTPSRRPVLLVSMREVELLSQEGVGLYDCQQQQQQQRLPEPYQQGTLVLTTHRLIYVPSKPTAESPALALSLPLVSKVERVLGFGPFSSPKVRVCAASSGGPPPLPVLASFRQGGCDPFFAKLQDTLGRKPWAAAKISPTATMNTSTTTTQSPSGYSSSSPVTFTPTGAGVAGIRRKLESEERRAAATLTEAFDDLKALMAHASELVDLARKMQAARPKVSTTAAAAATQLTEAATEEQFQQFLLELGLISPVSRTTVGCHGDFHSELSRQLCDFLLSLLSHHHRTSTTTTTTAAATAAAQSGTVTLVDAYCMYNRARGTDLVSPEDLLKACRLFEPLGLPLRLRTFPSGVLVVQALAGGSTPPMSELIQAYLQTHACVTALSLSEAVAGGGGGGGGRMPLLLCQEHLLEAEAAALLCRDETLAGPSFYLNFFAHPQHVDTILANLHKQTS